MSDIKTAISQIKNEREKAIAETLIEFYDTMIGLEFDPERAGKQATKIAMTINDIMDLANQPQDK